MQKKGTLREDVQITEENTTHRMNVIISRRRRLELQQTSEDKW